MKKAITIILSAMIILAFGAAIALAAVNVRGEYEGFGYFEIDLSRDVRWDNPEITVTDANGAAYAAELLRLDDDDIKFRVENIIEDQTYSISVSGIQGEEAVTCEVYAPSLKSNMIKKVDYDADDRELDIEFTVNISYSAECAVSISDAKGGQYESTIIEKDRDSIDVRVNGLTRGETYTVTVSGVISPETNEAGTYSREFVARDR